MVSNIGNVVGAQIPKFVNNDDDDGMENAIYGINRYNVICVVG